MSMTTEAELIRAICKDSFADFVKEFWSTITKEKLKWNWHMDVLCNELQELAESVMKGRKKDHDTVINISPGTSKSSICSILFPAWVWTRMPNAQFICASYSHDLALDLSSKGRDVIMSAKYKEIFPEVELRPDQNTKTNFKNTQGGYRYSVGAGGSVVGFHAHFIIVDDPLDPKKALSEAELKAVNHWMKHELRGRKVDKSVTVTLLIMQRLHQDDPSAQMLRGKRIRHYCIPADLRYEVKPKELERFYKDGLMDPVRLSREVLEEEESPAGLGEFGFAGQYGQNPVPAGGGMFKTDRIRRGTPPGKYKRILRFWDKAATEGGGAYTVGLLGALDWDDRVWVLHVFRKQMESHAREKHIKNTAMMDGGGVEVGIEQEGAGGGKESAEGTVRRLMGFRVRVLVPRGDKALRADEFSVQVNGGNVWMPETMWVGDPATNTGSWVGWAADYVEELKHFPHSTYKDQVDASSGFLSCVVHGRRRVGGLLSRKQKEARKSKF